MFLLGLQAHGNRRGRAIANGAGIPRRVLRPGRLDVVAGFDDPLFRFLLSGGRPRHLARGALVQRARLALWRGAAHPRQRLHPLAGDGTGGQGRDVAVFAAPPPSARLAGALQHDSARSHGNLPTVVVFQHRRGRELRSRPRGVDRTAAGRDSSRCHGVGRRVSAVAHRLLSHCYFRHRRLARETAFGGVPAGAADPLPVDCAVQSAELDRCRGGVLLRSGTVQRKR